MSVVQVSPGCSPISSIYSVSELKIQNINIILFISFYMFIIEEDGGGWWMVITISMKTTKVWAVSVRIIRLKLIEYLI